uniref:Uncharacterized protein n=1 Tax=Erythrolobus australicus TaxID=1077150 RepID=A0A7S1TKB7_9RHOD|mmetsp:Transcript_1968/g.5182  ORF Transcript_1968/g.5182 Transcript_1968/m.5182 type:complete len:377 (+) Transcript_1968:423-1553(+)|eukprot:CAMPEP_0185830320 /NCGR_PEP_ID=MMETSP1353-20130828/764_1 /TAXON_ID=1077150 /ORGANISM="Erythrolobus australicus, Strain CCMP3124" /LENGTH=376 /DNA_ID=CAMNT_0028528205 /DNA_START=398 /DNA_END=1528 /DNA_ORIENTATION=+
MLKLNSICSHRASRLGFFLGLVFIAIAAFLINVPIVKLRSVSADAAIATEQRSILSLLSNATVELTRCAACDGLRFAKVERFVFSPALTSQFNHTRQRSPVKNDENVTVVICADRRKYFYPIQVNGLLQQGATVVLYAFSRIERTLSNGTDQVIKPHWCCALALCHEACREDGAQNRSIIFLDSDTLANVSYITSQFSGVVRDRVIEPKLEPRENTLAASEAGSEVETRLAPLLVNSVPRREWSARWRGQEERDVIKVQTNIVALRATPAALDALRWWMSLDHTQPFADQGALHRLEPVGGCGVPGKVSCLANRDEQRYHCLGFTGHRDAKSKSDCMVRFRGAQFFAEELAINLTEFDIAQMNEVLTVPKHAPIQG